MVRGCMNALCLQMMKVCIYNSLWFVPGPDAWKRERLPHITMPWPVKPESDVPACKFL